MIAACSRIRPLAFVLLAGLLTVGLAAAEDEKAKPKEPAEKAKPAQPVSPIMAAARSKAPAPAADEVVVITNEDLDRLKGGGVYVVTPAIRPGAEGAPPAEGAAPGDAGDAERPASADGETTPPADEDPLEWMNRRRAEADERAEGEAEAQQRVATLEQRIQDLERRLIAIRNPLLARPVPPSDEEEAEYDQPWSELDGEQQVSRTQAELAKARAALVEARRALAAQQ